MRRSSFTLVAALSLAPTAACMGFATERPAQLTAAAHSMGASLYPVDTHGVSGLSDLTATSDDDGVQTVWALPERQRQLMPLNLDDAEHPALGAAGYRIEGIDEALDTESVTSLGSGRFAIGTESMEAGRAADSIFVLSTHGQALQVVQTLQMPYALWPGFIAAGNEGIEGLCHAGGMLLASSESRGRLADGQRFAPLGRYDLAQQWWAPMALRLTMPTGRISALQCRIAPGRPEQIEVLAIERHFGVGRLLHAWVPLHGGTDASAEPLVIEPTVLVDLAAWVTPIINFEGVVWLDDGHVALITDNHMMCVRGETYLLRLP